MSNDLGEIDITKSYLLLFWWHDQFKISWSKQHQKRWKVIQKYSYLPHGQKP